MENAGIEAAEENEFGERVGRKYRPVVAHDNDRAVIEMSSLDSGASSATPLPNRDTKLRVSTQPNMDSDAIDGTLPTHGVNGPQRESKLELFGFDSLVSILGLKSMTGEEQIPAPSSPRDGEDISITLDRPK